MKENLVIIAGRLTSDPVLRTTKDGKSVANFSLAIDRSPNSEGTIETDYPRCAAFDKDAEFVKKHLEKGCRCQVLGSIRTGSFQDKETGKTLFTTDIYVKKVQPIDWKDDRKNGVTTPQEADNAEAETTAPPCDEGTDW